MTNTPMTSREAFDEYISDGKHIFFDDMDEAYALWKTCEAQQASVIAELTKALNDMIEKENYLLSIPIPQYTTNHKVIAETVLERLNLKETHNDTTTKSD